MHLQELCICFLDGASLTLTCHRLRSFFMQHARFTWPPDIRPMDSDEAKDITRRTCSPSLQPASEGHAPPSPRAAIPDANSYSRRRYRNDTNFYLV